MSAKSETAATAFQDEPEAHKLYNQMIEAMRKADSLSYVSHYKWESEGRVLGDCTYQAWLKKPNYFRVESESAARGKCGILVGDGSDLWIYWPQGRPQWSGDEDTDADKKARLTCYMTKPARPGGHSIGHEVAFLGSGMSMPVIDPSTFHGYTDSLQQYLDGVKSLGTEKLGTDDCDKIELSIMKHQRSWYLWLSKQDHLPRKLHEIVRVRHDLIIDEEWSSVTLNAAMPESMFAWKPPEGWTEWSMPPIEAGLLKPGAKAPDFDLASADGKQIKLSDYRGQIVLFYIWRAG